MLASGVMDKIKIMTIGAHHFLQDQIQNINRVRRELANYYAADFRSVKTQFSQTDQF